jgi:predicted TIM-barrel fold metal-dependent hydrolase
MLRGAGAPILIDHCGRPDVTQGLNGAGFAALLALADTGRATVKLSGFSKFSTQDFPFVDTRRYVNALLSAFGPEHCIWASDWPFLKAPVRLDYGPLLQLFATAVPDAAVRHKILWSTPQRLFKFTAAQHPPS